MTIKNGTGGVLGEVSDVKRDLIELENTTRLTHKPTVTPAESTSAPGQGPTPILLGTVLGLHYDNTTDASYRIFKIPSTFVGDASFHIHWTKSANAAETGNTVRWRISYTVFQGNNAEIANGVSPTVLTVDDTYDDSGSDTSRIVYRTPNIVVTDFVPAYYVGLCVDYVSGSTTLSTSNPVLISADLLLREYINQ